MSRKLILTVACLMAAAAASAVPVEIGQPMPAPAGLKLALDHAPLAVCGNREQVYISAWIDPSAPEADHSTLVQYFTAGQARPFAAAMYLPDGDILIALDYDLDGGIDETGKVGDPNFEHSPCVHAAKIRTHASIG
jgi:hypothetical protein